MKKWLGALLALTLVLALAACGSSSSTDKSGGKKLTKLIVGASNVPHAQILKQAQPILKKKGIDLQIETYQDYIMPNKALASKDLDANYFQTVPYLELQMKENPSYDFVNAGGIHIEPIGVYSKKYKNLKDLPDGAHIIMSNSTSDHPRLLRMLEKLGLIKLKQGVNIQEVDIKDIVSNPKHLKFDTNYEAALLPKIFKNGEGDAVLINSNYALDNGLNPDKDAIAKEPTDPNYVNVITVRKGDENKATIKTLVEVLHSKEIQDWILKEYKGAVVPVSK